MWVSGKLWEKKPKSLRWFIHIPGKYSKIAIQTDPPFRQASGPLLATHNPAQVPIQAIARVHAVAHTKVGALEIFRAQFRWSLERVGKKLARKALGGFFVHLNDPK